MGRSIGTSIPELYRSVDMNGIILDCNYAYTDRLGYCDESEIIGTSFLEHTPEQHRHRLKAVLENWKRAGAHVAEKIVLQTTSGEEFEVMTSTENLYDHNRELIGSSSVMREISYLEEMRRLYDVSAREGYEHPHVMHRSLNYNGIIVDCNRTYLDRLGYTKEEVVGVSVLHHTAPRSKGNISAHMENWRNGLYDTAKIWMLRKDGSEFPVSLTATDERDLEGTLVGRTVALKPLDG